jgi:uncharacterized protein (TIGR02284 family)
METITKKTGEQLKDLIIINNDRYEGYKTAAEETKNVELKILFTNYSIQSEQFSNELQNLLPDHKYAPAPGETKNSGKLYRIFMDMKASLQNKDPKGILSSCEFGEDEAKKVYDTILEDREEIDYNLLEIIRNQRFSLQNAHDKIKSLCDQA